MVEGARCDGATRRHSLRTKFDESPELYDRARPPYPAQVFADLVMLTRLSQGARILEVGCGTGQATLPLAECGFGVTCIELGGQLAEFARRKLAVFPKVEVVNTSFEDWDPSGLRFDALVAFNAFHWIDPEVRYAKSAQVLRDEGALAVVAPRYVLPGEADPFWEEVREDYAAIGKSDDYGLPPHPDAVGDLGAEIEASGYFRNVAVRRYLWEVERKADDYIALLSTFSWHRALDERARKVLFQRIHRRIEARPERTVRLSLLATLNVARRL